MEQVLDLFMATAPLEALEAGLVATALAVSRMGALMYVFPLFTRTGIQTGVLRGAMALGLSLPVIPLVALEVLEQGPPEAIEIAGLAAKEVLIGMALGLIVGLPFWGAAAAGHIIDFQRGASVASMIDPNAGEETTPFGTFLFHIFAAVFLAAGLFERAVVGPLYESFAVWPVLAGFPRLEITDASAVLGLLGAMLEAGLVLAAPLVLAMLTVELGLALASRFVPQINVFFLALSFKTLLVILLMPLYFSVMIGYLRDDAAEVLRPLELLGGFFR